MKRPEVTLESVNDAWDATDKAFWLRELRAGVDELGTAWSINLRERQARWLATYAKTGAKSTANGIAQVTRKTSALWTREDPIFGPLVAYAQEALADRFVSEMTRRAVDGITVEIRDRHGMVVGEERRYSDTLLIHATKGLDAEKRWAKKLDAGGVTEDAWRAALARLVHKPEMLSMLDQIADEMVGGGTPAEG